MALLSMLIVGLVVGVLARWLTPGRHPGGLLITLLLGVAGSFTAGFIGRGMGFYYRPGEGPGLLASVLGAMLILLVYRVVRDRQGRS
jgi:uncharacterized membrane protein YeaQ/YmgE (transglycosylase-associated protein family)